MKILVTGGAGYIGSFMVGALLSRGYGVTVFDNLSRGHKDVLYDRAKFIEGDLMNTQDLKSLFGNEKIDAVMHFAGLIAVGESEEKPELYYENNVTGSKNLFDVAVNKGEVKKFIFSSSAAVYGNPVEIPIPEDHPKNPTSVYGKNKLEVEQILAKIRKEKNEVGFVSLRYFNAAGASLDGSLGENHNPETHIIPLAIKALISNSEFNLYGTDYDTPDGTCIRDYIHVIDLVEAHLLALEKLEESQGEYYYNVGTGKGYSNKEVLEVIEKIGNKKINIKNEKRREGDADRLIADPSKIKKELMFTPKYSSIEKIVETAWKWHSENENS